VAGEAAAKDTSESHAEDYRRYFRAFGATSQPGAFAPPRGIAADASSTMTVFFGLPLRGSVPVCEKSARPIDSPRKHGIRKLAEIRR